MYVITYLNAVVLGYGLFESLEAVEEWKKNFIPKHPERYIPVLIPKNHGNSTTVCLSDDTHFMYSSPR